MTTTRREAEGAPGDDDSSPTSSLAGFVAGLTLDDVPQKVLDRVKQCLLDTIGATYLGARWAESTSSILAGIRSLDNAQGDATVVGVEDRFAQEHAVFLNGTLAHSLDFDDTSDETKVHPGVVVAPIALTLAESLDSSGEDLLLAVVASYEVACRVGAALGDSAYERGFHITGLAGAFAAAATAARLMGMSRSEIENAWGLVGSMAGGSMQYLENGSWNKRIHPGLAGRSALLAVMLTRAGVRGAARALCGRHGLLNSYSNEPQPDLLTDGLGEDWVLMTTGVKAYPSCRMTHGAIDAIRELRARGYGPESGDARLRVALSPVAHSIVGGPSANKLRPGNTVEAQFSVNFQVAAAWREGTVDWPSYSLLNDEGLLDLASSITSVPDDTLSITGAVVTLDLPSGPVEVRVDEPAGGPDSGTTWELAEAKVRSGVIEGHGAAVDDLVALVRRLEELGDSSELMAAVRGLGAVTA